MCDIKGKKSETINVKMAKDEEKEVGPAVVNEKASQIIEIRMGALHMLRKHKLCESKGKLMVKIKKRKDEQKKANSMVKWLWEDQMSKNRVVEIRC
jgi:hypothetical protein